MFRRIDRRLFTILMIVFVQIVGASMIWPILPLYARDQYGMSEGVVTLLFTSFFAAQFLAGPYLGRWSDNYGRLPVLILSQIGTVISFIMVPLAPTAGWLFFSRILDGVTGGNIVVAQAYITDITPPKQRTEALGYIFAAFGGGFLVGPAAGGILSSAFGPQVPFYIAAVAATLTVILTWFALDESVTAEQRAANRTRGKGSLNPGQIVRNVPLLLVLIVGFGVQFSLSVFQSTFALFGEDVLFVRYDAQTTSLGIGLLLSCAGFGQLLTQFFILKPLLRHYDEAILVIIGNVVRGVGVLFLVIVTVPWLAIPSMIMLAMGSGVAVPSLQSLATGTVDDNERGGVLGIFQSASSLGIIFGTALAGITFAISPPFPMAVSGVLALLLVLPTLYLRRDQMRRKLDVEEAAAAS